MALSSALKALLSGPGINFALGQLQGGTPRGRELFNALRSRFRGVSQGDLSVVYQTALRMIDSGGLHSTLGTGRRLRLQDIPLNPHYGLWNTFDERIVYTVQARVARSPGEEGRWITLRVGADSPLTREELSQHVDSIFRIMSRRYRREGNVAGLTGTVVQDAFVLYAVRQF